MDNQLMSQISSPVVWELPRRTSAAQAGKVVCTFLDTVTTSFGRATAYNSREEQQAKELDSHGQLLKLDRDLYAAFLTLPGVTNRSVQMGTKNLLSTQRNGETILTAEQEQFIIYKMLQDLPAPAMLRTLEAFRVGDNKLGIKRQNNNRSRKLILRTLLGANNLDLWTVKYRAKMRTALTHAWGRRLTGAICSILEKDGQTQSPKERGILRKNIDKFSHSFQYSGEFATASRARGIARYVGRARECVAYILGANRSWTLPMIKAVHLARKDLKAGKILPLEVLEGIRSRFHKKVDKGEVIELTKKNFTKTQRKNVQRSAKAAGVQVDMDPMDYDAVDLYIYTFEMGLTDDISTALKAKGEKSAQSFPVHYDKVAILVDSSQSMWGHETQKLRPMAATLALRDMLQNTGEENVVRYCGGHFNPNDFDAVKDHKNAVVLPRPQGATDLAGGLVELLEDEPDAVFILSDGYENAPAGRIGEVVEALEEIGITTPIYHLNPVFAAESTKGGLRQFCDKIPAMPVQRPDSLGLSFLRNVIESDPVRGINAILGISLRALPKAS